MKKLLLLLLIPELILAGNLLPMDKVFSHRKHQSVMKKMNVRCDDCHAFSIKPIERGPLASDVKERFLKAPKNSCHQCHMNNIKTPRRNSCSLCHINVEKLQPIGHHNHWRKRHGRMSQLDSNACYKCHSRNDCSTCHLQRDNMNPFVHHGNFRYTHSIKARAMPQSCTTCHTSSRFCIDCHTGKTR